MHTRGYRVDSAQTGKTGWNFIHVSDSDGRASNLGGSAQEETNTIPPALIHLFEHAEDTPLSLSERFPRLTFVAVAIALLVTVLTAEFDYLRGAGYFWP